MRFLSTRLLLAGALAALGAGCSDTETKVVEVPTMPACSVQYPYGECASGQSCLEGGCVATASLCSDTNTSGACATGLTCHRGDCVPPDLVPEDGGGVDCTATVYTQQPSIVAHTATTGKAVLTVDGRQYKDLNDNGVVDRYEDWRYPELCRARDLVARMSVAEKVALMSETSSIGGGTTDGTVPADVQAVIVEGHVRQALIRIGTVTGTQMASYLNAVQELCEAQPLGIPFVVTGDPSHAFGLSVNAGTGNQSLTASTVLSPWPQPLGLGAIGDTETTFLYGDTVRREFMAMGFRWQLGPMADVATEPRWARVQGTFGENAHAVAGHVKACIEGFQAGRDGGLRGGIAATMKHFPGAGPDEDGKDSHMALGKWNVYPGDNFAYHLVPFRAAIDAGAAAVMPCYSIFKGIAWDPQQVGAAYSKGLVTDLLKTELGFDGMVTSDWGIMSFAPNGVESLTNAERAALFLEAGSHQLGMDSSSNIQAAYDQGLVTAAQLDASAEKILELSFKLGIFEDPYVDAAAAAAEIRSEANLRAGFEAQKKAIVLLKNAEHTAAPCYGFMCAFFPPPPGYLPLSGATTRDTDGDGTVEIHYDGASDGLVGGDAYDAFLDTYDYTSAASGATLAVTAVDDPAVADVAVVRIAARYGTYFGLDAGVPLSLDAPFPGRFSDDNAAAARRSAQKVVDLLRLRDGYTDSTGAVVPAANPTLKIVVVMYMERPAVVRGFVDGLVSLDETPGQPGSYPSVSDPANLRADGVGGVDGLLVDFGAYDRAVLDFLFDANEPAGFAYGSARLPMELPSSEAAVEAQYEDVPADTLNPTYGLGAGRTL